MRITLPYLRSIVFAFLFSAGVPSLLALTISPLSPTLSEGATQQFTSDVVATWTTTCGSIDMNAGLYTAPLAPGSCTITATAADGSGSIAATTATITSPVVITPSSATTAQGQTQQFTANVPMIWTTSCGSIDANGLFTASVPQGSICTIGATAASGPAYTAAGAVDTVGPAPTLTIAPLTPTLNEGATQQFTSNVAVTWAASCGSIDSNSGLYTAPLAPGSCNVTATATDGSGHTAATTATITSPLIITPASATTGSGLTQQFTANLPVLWTASCGSITASGLFTASVAQGSVCKIGATAASGTAYTASAVDTVGPAPALTISPTQVTLNEGATQQFKSNLAVTWTSDCGTISSTGLFTAPLYAQMCHITATATSGSGSVSASASVVSPITISPVSASTVRGLTQQFTASVPVKWTATCGSITSIGLFTASAAVGTICAIEATAASGTPYTVFAHDTVLASTTFSLTPMSVSLKEHATQQFVASSPATWTASCGAISIAGLYTAPLAPGSCTVKATATDGSAHTASASVTVTSPMTITPAVAQLHAIAKQQFAASVPVAWSASCGTIDASSGLFKAPTRAGSCIVTATATGSTAYTARSTVNVDVVNYLSWKGGSSDIGLQSHETLLSPSNVNPSRFAVKWSTTLDGSIYAQPLYMNGLTINGVPHNVVFVATSNDSIYAFDGDTGALLWHRSFLSAGVTAVTGTSVNSPTGQIGVLGTPVIDPITGTLYAVAETAELGATYFPHRLHAIDVTTGHEKFNGPVLISDVKLPPIHKLQRPGLALANGMVYVSFGSISDRTPYHGFVFAFDHQTLAKKYVWNSTVTGSEGGIWMSGGAPAVDASGYLYVTTGNGSFDGSANFGEAAVKLSPSLHVVDYFAPYNYATLNASDSDLGSGTVALLPDQNGTIVHEVVVCGKPPSIYVLNRDNMGKVGSSADNIVKRLDFRLGTAETCFATPAFWNSRLYIAAAYDSLEMFAFSSTTGLPSAAAAGQGPFLYGLLGAQPVVSANGTINGIVWTLDPITGQLIANNALNVATQLYAAPVRGGVNHFAVPTVVNGHVYVGGRYELVAYSVQ